MYEKQSQANQSTGEAAKNTWFVPNTPSWANVESGNVLQNMLESIATKKSSIAAATKTADEQIDQDSQRQQLAAWLVAGAGALTRPAPADVCATIRTGRR